jgi:hypothetical protein
MAVGGIWIVHAIHSNSRRNLTKLRIGAREMEKSEQGEVEKRGAAEEGA